MKGSTGGNRRFFFVTAEQTVSFIEVAPPVVRSLADGHHAIVDARGVLNGLLYGHGRYGAVDRHLGAGSDHGLG